MHYDNSLYLQWTDLPQNPRLLASLVIKALQNLLENIVANPNSFLSHVYLSFEENVMSFNPVYAGLFLTACIAGHQAGHRYGIVIFSTVCAKL